MQYQFLRHWLGREDSNLRTSESKFVALTLGEFRPIAVARWKNVRRRFVGHGHDLNAGLSAHCRVMVLPMVLAARRIGSASR